MKRHGSVLGHREPSCGNLGRLASEFGSPWGHLGGVWETSWAVLGVFGERFGDVLSGRGSSWGGLGGIMERLGSFLDRLGSDFAAVKSFYRGMSPRKRFFNRNLLDKASKNQALKLNRLEK